MWIFSTLGFYSAVRIVRDGKLTNQVMVRARVRRHLDNLFAAYPALLCRTTEPVMETPNADYRYRIIIKLTQWKRLAENLAGAVDYPNFKNDAMLTPAWGGSAERAALHNVWAEMHTVQELEN